MEIRDVVHGTILIEPHEVKFVHSPFYQRLRTIKQLGFAEHSFPSAVHNRFTHSLGAMTTASQAFESIFGRRSQKGGPLQPWLHLQSANTKAFKRFRAIVRLASALHDIGHGPMSHTSEMAMPELKDLQLPVRWTSPQSAQATHEHYTLKILLDSPLTALLKEAGQGFGFGPLEIASLICPEIECPSDFFHLDFGGGPSGIINYRPILQQLISSELDADRMDYLLRDSLHTGVSYGQFDFEWLIQNLTAHLSHGTCSLALEQRAIYAFEDFLLSRFHMFLMVYFHHKTVIYDAMLAKYFQSDPKSYQIPADIDSYFLCNDAQLLTHLSQSKNPWAKRITLKRPFRMLVEIHRGSSKAEHAQRIQEIAGDLQAKKIPHLLYSSTGELSKYFGKKGPAIQVRCTNHFDPPYFLPIHDCTDLFRRLDSKRTISRLYVPEEKYFELKKKRPPLAL